MTSFSESEVEEVALTWLADLGWNVKHGSDIAPDTPEAERDGYDQVVLERRVTQPSSFHTVCGTVTRTVPF